MSQNSTAGVPVTPARVVVFGTVLVVIVVAVVTRTWNAATVIPLLVGAAIMVADGWRHLFTRSQK